MAEIVLGIATSHSPQLRIAPEQWHLLIEKDQKDPRFDYQQLLRDANPALGKELTEAIFQKNLYDAEKSAYERRISSEEYRRRSVGKGRTWNAFRRDLSPLLASG